jgi:hypothetical protein
MEENKKVLLTVELKVAEAIKNIADLKAQIKSLQLEQAGLDRNTVSGAQKFEALGQQIKELNTKSLEYQKVVQNSAKYTREQSGSIEELKAKLSLQTAEYNKLSEAERKLSSGKELEKSIKSTSDELKNLEKNIGNNTRSIGDYGLATKQLPGIFGQFQSAATQTWDAVKSKYDGAKQLMTDILELRDLEKVSKAEAKALDTEAVIAEEVLTAAKLAGAETSLLEAEAETARAAATKAATIATEAGTEASKLLKIALASTGIGLLVVLLGSLVAYFTQTNEGSKLLSKTTAVLGAIFKELIGFVAKGVQGIRDFFEGIKSFPDLMSKVGNAIKENLINRLESLSVIGKAIVKILSGDVKAGFKDLANGAIQMGTGVTNAIDKVGDALSSVAKGVGEAASAQAKIKDMERALGKYKRESIETLATLEANAAKYSALLGKGGQSATTKEREEAMNKLIETENQMMEIKISIAKKTAAIKKAQLDLENKQTGDAMGETKTAYAEANAEVIKLVGEHALAMQNIDLRRQKLHIQILQEEISAEQAVLAQNKETILQQINNDKIGTDEKLKLIEKIKSEQDKSFQQQNESFDAYAQKHIDINKLIEISDGQKLTEEIQNIGLSKAAQSELLKVITARKNELSSSNQEEIKLLKEVTDNIIKASQDAVKAYVSENEIKIASQKATGEEILKYQSELAQREYDQETDALELKLKYKQISEAEYDRLLIEANQKRDLAIAKNAKQAIDFDKQRKLTDLNNQLAAVQNNIDLEYSLKLKALKAEQEAEVEAAKEKGANVQLINEKYAKAEQDLAMETTLKKLDTVKQYADSTLNILNAADQLQKQIEAGQLQDAEEKNSGKVKLLDDQLKKGIISQKEHDKQVAQSAAELDKKKKQIAYDQAVREKELNIFKTIVNTASAVMGAISEFPGPVGIGLGIAAGVMGAIELATIIATPLPKASRGVLLKGKSHAQGGIPIEAEGGEAIINKRSTAMFAPILSMLNEAGGGVAFAHSPTFNNDGGFASRQAVRENSLTQDQIQDAMEKAVAKIKVVTTVEDYRKADLNYTKIQDRSNY